MAIRSRSTIKSFFNTGDTPSESNFSDFIDSTIFPNEDNGIGAGFIKFINDTGYYSKMSLSPDDVNGVGAFMIESNAGNVIAGHNSPSMFLKNTQAGGSSWIGFMDYLGRDRADFGYSNINELFQIVTNSDNAGVTKPLVPINIGFHGIINGVTGGHRAMSLMIGDDVTTGNDNPEPKIIFWRMPYTVMESLVVFDLFAMAYTFKKGTLTLPPGTSAEAGIIIPSGVLKSTPSNGRLEYNGTNLYFTVGGVRKTITWT